MSSSSESYEVENDVDEVESSEEVDVVEEENSVEETGDNEETSAKAKKKSRKEKKATIRCRTRKLLNMFSKFNEAQREAVISLGFGGLFDITFTHFPTKYVEHFAKAFDDRSYVFRASDTKEFLVTKHDVHDCFLLPFGPEPLPLLPTARKKEARTEAVKAIKRRWRSLFNITKRNGEIPLDLVEKAILRDSEGGDWFKQCFILFSVSYFLCPTSSSVVDLRLLSAVEDVPRIREYDWCSFVLESVAGAGYGTREKVNALLGCWPFLMITYFHRFDFRGKASPTELPLIKHWDHDKMLDRLKGELVGGTLGRQIWSSNKYPLCLNPPPRINDENQTTPRVHEDDVERVREPSTKAAVNEGLNAAEANNKFIVISIPSSLDDDEEIRAKAVDEVHDLYLKLQRNAVAFHTWYTEAALRLKVLTTPKAVDIASPSTQSTQALFENPAFHRYVDEVVDNALRMKSTTVNAPIFEDPSTSAVRDVVNDILQSHETEDNRDTMPLHDESLDTPHSAEEPSKPTHQVPEVPVFNVPGLQLNDTDIEILGAVYSTAEIREALHGLDPIQAANVVLPAQTITPPTNLPVKEASISPDATIKRTDDVTHDEPPLKRTRLSVAEKTTPPPNIVPTDSHSCSSMKCRSRGRGDGIGCSINCGPINCKPLVVSLFMRYNQFLMKEVNELRQQVVDYCFLDDYNMDPDEIVVDFGGDVNLSRNDIQSLMPDKQTSPKIIDCWAKLLNIIEADEFEVPRMVFMCVRGSGQIDSLVAANVLPTPKDQLKDDLYKIWDAFVVSCGTHFYMNADLFFIPVIVHEHFFVVCVNFKYETIDILDNQKMSSSEEDSDVHKYAHLAAVEGLSDYLERFRLPKAGGITDFKLRFINLKWQDKESNNSESALFCMMHMLLYEGSVFDDSNLASKKSRKFLVCQLAASLLLADCNLNRESLLENVRNFVKIKPNILKVIQAQRHITKKIESRSK